MENGTTTLHPEAAALERKLGGNSTSQSGSEQVQHVSQ